MPDSVASPTPKRKLRWYQFSLRSLLIFVTVVACACSWLAIKVRQAKQERIAAETLENAGCHVLFNYDLDNNGNIIKRVSNPKNAWMKSILGEDLFLEVRSVWFENRVESKGAFALLWDCPHLKTIVFNDSKFTDEDLKNLAGLKVTSINLWYTDITDKGLKTLKSFPQLTWLSLTGTKITDEGLENLNSLKQLKYLDLARTTISDAGLKNLSDLPNLSHLIVADTKVTSEGARMFEQKHPNVKVHEKEPIWISD